MLIGDNGGNQKTPLLATKMDTKTPPIATIIATKKVGKMKSLSCG